jgi:hypothetical protein
MGSARLSSRLGLAVAGALAAAGVAACALDFDRFDPVVGDAAAPRADVSPTEDAVVGDATPSVDDDVVSEATAPATADTGPDEAGANDASDAGAAVDGADAGCAPSPSCVASAHGCGATCAQQEQQCASRCSSNNCRTNCTRTETSCVTQCSDTCSTCTQSAGCRSASSCSAAAKP